MSNYLGVLYIITHEAYVYYTVLFQFISELWFLVKNAYLIAFLG